MKSIQARYKRIRNKLPEQYSTYICFARAVKYQKFDYEAISRNFDLLVDKEDYAKDERYLLIRELHKLSNDSEERDLEVKNRL